VKIIPDAVVPTGVPGLVAWYWITEHIAEGGRELPTRGHWVLTHEPSGMRAQPAFFYGLHAVIHMARRLDGAFDWTRPVADVQDFITSGGVTGIRIAQEDADAHDLAEQPGWVEFENGPSVEDEDGTLRKFLARDR
jgi:hypothetical protein